MWYLQCQFQKGNSHYTAWIPEQKIKINKYYKLKMNGEWQDGWKLISKSEIAINEHQLSFQGYR